MAHVVIVVGLGLLHGGDPRSDQCKTIAYVSLLGSAAGEIARDFGILATDAGVAALAPRMKGIGILADAEDRYTRVQARHVAADSSAGRDWPEMADTGLAGLENCALKRAHMSTASKVSAAF